MVGGIKRLSAKLANLQRQQAAEEEAEATRRLADLLTANLHRCRQGDTSVEVGGTQGLRVLGGLEKHSSQSESLYTEVHDSALIISVASTWGFPWCAYLFHHEAAEVWK